MAQCRLLQHPPAKVGNRLTVDGVGAGDYLVSLGAFGGKAGSSATISTSTRNLSRFSGSRPSSHSDREEQFMDATERGAELDQREAAAMASADVSALTRIWSDRLVITPPGGPPVDKSTALGLVTSGVLSYKRVERSTEQVVDHGAWLLSMGREQVTSSAGDRSHLRRFSHVWSREEQDWRLVARHASPIPELAAGVTRVQHVKVPVTDLARSLVWYRDLLGLEWNYEFTEDDIVRGVSLFHPAGGFSVALRDRDAIVSRPDLHGFDPFALAVARRDDLDVLADRCEELGFLHGEVEERADGAVLDVTDPDGTIVRFYHLEEQTGFVGIAFRSGASPTLYDAPRLEVPPGT